MPGTLVTLGPTSMVRMVMLLEEEVAMNNNVLCAIVARIGV
jgi:hypothetical protein